MVKLTRCRPKRVITPPCLIRHFHLAHELGVALPARRRQNLSRSKLRTAVVGGALIAVGFAASGCASHRFVRDQVEVVDNRVMEVDGRVTQVEGTAGQALERANAALTRCECVVSIKRFEPAELPALLIVTEEVRQLVAAASSAG